MDTKNNRPNLLYIHSDQHNPFVTGCYGDPMVNTPNLDRLAANGVVFDNAYCPSPICVPSRMATLTGQHPSQIDVWANNHILDSGIPTLAHSMGAAGYNPVLIGRMHALGCDQLHGYAERLVGDHRPNYSGGTPVDHGEFEGTQDAKRISLLKSGSGQSAYQVHDEYVTAAAINYLNHHGIERKCGLSEEPFCLTIGYMLPHQPFLAREEDYNLYRGKMTMPKHPESFSEKLHPYIQAWREGTGTDSVSDDEILRARTAYWALVTRLDTMIGDVISALKANGLDDNTIIIYTSDHGEQVGEHGMWWKQTFYEHSVRIPLIMSWPGVIPAGKRSQKIVSSLDLTATMLHALEAPELPQSPGRSFLEIAKSPDANIPWEDEVFSEYCTNEGDFHRMIRSGDWKLIYYHGMQPQLFNLIEDPNELVDQAQNPSFLSIREELMARVLEDWDPELIAMKMEVKKKENEILYAWAQQTRPVDSYRWDLRPSMYCLNLEQS